MCGNINHTYTTYLPVQLIAILPGFKIRKKQWYSLPQETLEIRITFTNINFPEKYVTITDEMNLIAEYRYCVKIILCFAVIPCDVFHNTMQLVSSTSDTSRFQCPDVLHYLINNIFYL